MADLLESIKRLFIPVMPLPPGIFHYQSPPDTAPQYRLHLRVEPDGSGILIVNASTVLHLNQTATEYAFHLINQTHHDKVAKELSSRYRVSQVQALRDFQNLNERIQTLIQTPDLDPQSFLDFERTTPYSKKISAPLRLDCAVTYKLPSIIDANFAPVKRVDHELTTEEWFAVFDKAWKVGIPHIILTGGEPTLREDLPALISHTESNGQVVGLLSDGHRLVDQGYLHTLLQTGLDHLMLSLQIDDQNSWSALECVLPEDLFVGVHLTLTLHNVMNTNETMKRLKDMGVKAISLSASDPALHSSLLHSRNEAATLGLPLIWDLPVPYSSFNPVALETQVDNPITGAGNAWLYVEPDGDVLPAQGINQVLGNITRDSWETIWH